MLERMLRDLAATGAMEVVALRYFNPIGADPKMRSGLQDERPDPCAGQDDRGLPGRWDVQP
ncbi:hypothetical protein [Propionibacterium freudenreichii]|uniref:hypothetical protein n=1 Tax=Propionibacterium freudenreichii TaxID=1744 RepID=UPI003D7604A9